jgi:hypothetical protein
MKHFRKAMVMAAAVAAMLVATFASATSYSDVQANDPQVATDPSSNTTAVFPTNKQNEPSIAVNPIANNYLIAGSNDEQQQPPCGPGPVRGSTAAANDCSFFPDVGTSGVYVSSNGGTTWTNKGLLDDQTGWVNSALVSDGDPAIVYGPKPVNGVFRWSNGARAYYATLASYKTGQGPASPAQFPEVIAVSYSDDNGTTWSAPVLASVKNNPNTFNDKESTGVDANPASPYFGRVYVAWTRFNSIGTAEPIMVAVSTNGGNSFSLPKQLSPAYNNYGIGGRQGSAITTGPDGSVYVAFEQGSSQVVSISRNGGGSWSRPITIGPVTDIHDPIPGANFRTDSFASIAADQSTGSTVLYAAWVNRTVNGGRVVVSKSTNRGVSWSSPVVVSAALEGYAFFQGLAVAPDGSRVDIAYQALMAINPNTFGTGNATIDSWYRSSVDGGASWSAPSKVSSLPSDPAASAQNNLARQFWGDYNTLVSTNTNAFFIYTDSRTGVGCPAVDSYQKYLAGLIAGPVAKPAPQTACASSQFGNTDVFVSTINP